MCRSSAPARRMFCASGGPFSAAGAASALSAIMLEIKNPASFIAWPSFTPAIRAVKIGQIKRSRQGICSGAGGGSGGAEWTKRDDSEQASRDLKRKDGPAPTADPHRFEGAHA